MNIYQVVIGQDGKPDYFGMSKEETFWVVAGHPETASRYAMAAFRKNGFSGPAWCYAPNIKSVHLVGENVVLPPR
ncbi:MAG: hypothetical protein ACE5JS_23590 [Nitrospinota bacterium]